MTEPEAIPDPPAQATPDAEADAAAPSGDAGADATGDATTPDDAEKPKKKKRKKRGRSSDGTSGLRDSLDEQGRDRPAFLLGFPEDADLAPLIRAFEKGNYALVREDAPRLIERTSDAEVKAAAAELLRRIEPDPLVKFILAVAVALFCTVVGYVYLSH